MSDACSGFFLVIYFMYYIIMKYEDIYYISITKEANDDEEMDKNVAGGSLHNELKCMWYSK